MRSRRTDDRALRLVRARPTRPFVVTAISLRPAPAAPDDGLLLLLEGDDGEGLLVAGAAACRVPQGSSEADLLDADAAMGAAALLRERARMEKRQRLPDQLIAYFEELALAESEDAVLRALADHALRIVGAHRALALGLDRERELLRAPAPREGEGGHRVCLLWDERFERPGLVSAPDARRGRPAAAAAPLFGDPRTVLVAHVPVGGDGVLVLTERREERIFEPEDWDVLRALTLQAEMALRRVRLLESVRSLSLTDPLTGLANRRHLEVVMEHAWAAARRGEPLTLAVLDLDGFKEVNDGQGHEAGDRLLCAVADVLRAETRGSDVAVRYGGDEFLVILPGGDPAGAERLVGRVRARLAGQVGVSAGIVAYDPAFPSAEAMIREADRRLYAGKRGRCAAADAAPTVTA
jgi:diguanylate cyclase (GGDEF)-like protein